MITKKQKHIIVFLNTVYLIGSVVRDKFAKEKNEKKYVASFDVFSLARDLTNLQLARSVFLW